MRDDFDRDFATLRRQMRVMQRVFMVIWAAMIVAVGFVLTHPEVIGEFARRIANGFRS